MSCSIEASNFHFLPWVRIVSAVQTAVTGLHVPTTILEESLLVFRPSSCLAATLLCKRREQVQKLISVHLSNLAL